VYELLFFFHAVLSQLLLNRGIQLR
jgi:hypothetical protein